MKGRHPRVPREDFPSLFSSGRRAGGRFMTLIGDSSKSGDAVVVSKKAAASAVARNRLRRVIRAALREGGGHIGAVVALVRPEAAAAPARALREEALRLLARVSEPPR
ncbi:MAG: ribonuclease P protein component [Patescibacteria group bacterium]|nr:ribonuclease P protein component [Patescibacteria group bacterium]MDE1966236.1 ribonuclease P protein component [Patescibacteria group bacterium]